MLLLPSILIVLLLDLFPIIYVIFVSLYDRSLFDKASDFIAIKNYLAIFRDKNFLTSIKNSIIWTVGTTFFEVLFGMAIALLLNRNFKFRNVARGLMLVPYVIPAIVSTLIWKYMFNDLIGLVNFILNILHITNNPIAFMSSPKLAMLVVISINVWTYTPFVIINMLAALQGINTDLYDAAAVDGANNIHIFKSIIIPSVAPILIITVLLRIVWNFQKFDIIYLMTKGGPLTATTTIPIMLYNEAFVSYDLGKASAMAVFIFVLLGILAAFYIKLFENIEKKVVE